MKNISLLFLLSVFIFSCTKKQTGNTIEGKISGYRKFPSTVFLIDEVNDFNKKIDSSKIDVDGSFSFKTKIKQKSLYVLNFGYNHSDVFLILDSAAHDVIVKTDSISISKGVCHATGSKATALFQNFLSGMIADKDSLAILSTRYITALKNKSVDTIMLAEFGNASLRNSYNKKVAFLDSCSDAAAAIFAVPFTQFRPEHPEELKILKRLSDRIVAMNVHYKMATDFIDIIANAEKNNSGVEEPNEVGLQMGSVAPEISLNDPQGNIRKLSSLRGHIVLVDFWASWCGPCRAENPNVVAQYQKFKNKGFEIFSVSLDQSADRWKAAIMKDNLAWANHVSELTQDQWGSKTAAIWGVEAIPMNYLLDVNGKIIGKNLRGEQLSKMLSLVFH